MCKPFAAPKPDMNLQLDLCYLNEQICMAFALHSIQDAADVNIFPGCIF